MNNLKIKIHKKYHEDSDLGEFKDYPRNLSLREIYSRLDKKKKILDVGCGSGIIGEFFLKNNYEVYGLEISSEAAKIAKKKGIKVTISDVDDKFPFKSNYFEEIFLGDIIEHVYFPEALIAECIRVLKPKGRLVMSTVNYSNIIWRIKYLIKGKIPISEGGDRNKNIAYWEHIRLWDDDSLISFMQANKFEHKRTVGINYFGIFPKFLYNRFPKYLSAVNIYIFLKK